MRMRWCRSALMVLGLVAIGAVPRVYAQEDIDLRIFRPQIDLSGETFQNKPFDDMPNDEYGSDQVNFFATIPLGKTHIRWEKNHRASQFFLHAFGSRATPDITFLTGDQRKLYTGGVALSGVWLSRQNNLYIAAIGDTFAEDDRTIHDFDDHMIGLFLGTHKIRETFTLVYGAASTYKFGRGLVLPIVGGVWWINPKWTLAGVLPVSLVATYGIRENLALIMSLGVGGNRYRFENDGEFPGQPEIVYLSTLQSKALAQLDWKTSKDVTLYLQAGTVQTLQFAFSGDSDVQDDKFVDDSAPAAGYLKAGIRFSFGKTLLDTWH